MTSDDAPPFDRIGPARAASPLVMAVPHAGRIYPPELGAASAVPMALLEQLEDRHADRLIGRAVAEGAVAIVARVARAWIDLNRGEDDLDPSLHGGPAGRTITARARSGLGLVPRRIGRRELWRAPPDARAVAGRIARVHRPYHAAIAAELTAAHRRHGQAVLLDCHSMPTIASAHPAHIVIGDRHGTSADGEIVAAIAGAGRAAGYRVAVNAPYAGAHAIERHGRPLAGIHAVQIEIDRALYLAPDMRTLTSGLARVEELIAALGRAAVAASPPGIAIVAE